MAIPTQVTTQRNQLSTDLEVDSSRTKNPSYSGRRLQNLGKSKDPSDAVTRQELTDLYTQLTAAGIKVLQK